MTLDRLLRRARGAGIVAGRLRDGGTEVTVYGEADAAWAYEIGSVTKVYGAQLLLELERAGVVRRDERLADCLPPPWAVPPSITLEQLARHTSGLPRVSLGVLRAGRRTPQDPYSAITVSDLQRIVARVRARRHRRGRYSNLGAALLGHALAARGGAPWDDLLRRHVLDPLGLHETGLSPESPLAQPHSARGKPVPPWSLPAFAAAGALRSTVHDLLAFLRAQLETAEPSLAWQRRRGLLWHNGGTGGSASFAAIEPERCTGIVLLANAAIAGPLTGAGLRLLQPQ